MSIDAINMRLVQAKHDVRAAQEKAADLLVAQCEANGISPQEMVGKILDSIERKVTIQSRDIGEKPTEGQVRRLLENVAATTGTLMVGVEILERMKAEIEGQ